MLNIISSSVFAPGLVNVKHWELRTALQRMVFKEAVRQFCTYIQLPVVVLHNVFLPMVLGVIPVEGGVLRAQRRPAEPSGPVAAGPGCITLQPGNCWASIAVALLVPKLLPRSF